MIKETIKRGICKVNYATELRLAYSNGVKEVIAKDPKVIDPKKYGLAGREKVTALVRQKIKVCGSINKA